MSSQELADGCFQQHYSQRPELETTQIPVNRWTDKQNVVYPCNRVLFGEGNGTPLQCFCLENPMDGGAWWAAVLGVARVGHDWVTSLSLFTFMHWRRKWQPTPVFLPGESAGMGEPGGLPSMGSHRVGHDWSDLAAEYYFGDEKEWRGRPWWSSGWETTLQCWFDLWSG